MAKSGPSSRTATLAKTPQNFWEKVISHRTDLFIEWCNENTTERIKLFSDSTQDACEERRTKSQLATAKKEIFEVLACYIFEKDEEFAAEWEQRPTIFITATQRRLSNLRTKYTEQIKCLGQTGAGLTIEDLEKDDCSKNLIATIASDFPWFSSLHGWWRKNPAYNTVFSDCDPKQNYVAQATNLFNMQPNLSTHGDRMPRLPQQSVDLATTRVSAGAVASGSGSQPLITATTSAPATIPSRVPQRLISAAISTNPPSAPAMPPSASVSASSSTFVPANPSAPTPISSLAPARMPSLN